MSIEIIIALKLCAEKKLTSRNQKMCEVAATTGCQEPWSPAVGDMSVDCNPEGKALSVGVEVGALE